MSEIAFLPAHEMARAIRERALSSREVLDAHLRQIKRHNPSVNAIVDSRRRGGLLARPGGR